MELEIDSAYDEEQSRLKYVNKRIEERLSLIRKYYIVIEMLSCNKKQTDGRKYYRIYKKPKFKMDIAGQALFLYLKDNYFITEIYIKDDTVYDYTYNPNETIKNQSMLEYMFNSMDDVKVKIIKQYCDWEFK